LLTDFDLTSQSVVVDVGGYTGKWSSDLFSRFLCRIHILEPIPTFAAKLRTRFQYNPLITVTEAALGSVGRDEVFRISGDATSAFIKRGEVHHVRIVSAVEWFAKMKLDHIDLMTMNCEGGEYEILPHLIETGLAKKIDRFLIQFHDYKHLDAKAARDRITESLARTHQRTMCYPFLWEKWVRLDN